MNSSAYNGMAAGYIYPGNTVYGLGLRYKF
jgi:hypothetical protein